MRVFGKCVGDRATRRMEFGSVGSIARGRFPLFRLKNPIQMEGNRSLRGIAGQRPVVTDRLAR